MKRVFFTILCGFNVLLAVENADLYKTVDALKEMKLNRVMVTHFIDNMPSTIAVATYNNLVALEEYYCKQEEIYKNVLLVHYILRRKEKNSFFKNNL